MSRTALTSEFSFELLVCRWAELGWPPDADDAPALVVSRQLGTQRRRWDTIVIECNPAGLGARQEFGDRRIDSELLPVVRNAPAEWDYYRDALPDPGYDWRYIREAIHRAGARDLIDKRKNGRRIEIRRKRPYPDWVERIVAIENKPDLDASAAAALTDQLTHDVETALADEVWLATSRTGDRVEPALLEEFPVEVGVLTFDFADETNARRIGVEATAVDADAATVDWFPSTLDTSADSEVFSSEEKRRRRRWLAERAYGKGWRAFTETMRPDCRHFELRRSGQALVPYCEAKSRCQSEAECGTRCGFYEPEPPQWRTNGWPIEGGPGQGIRTLLERRRQRTREDAADHTRDE